MSNPEDDTSRSISVDLHGGQLIPQGDTHAFLRTLIAAEGALTDEETPSPDSIPHADIQKQLADSSPRARVINAIYSQEIRATVEAVRKLVRALEVIGGDTIENILNREQRSEMEENMLKEIEKKIAALREQMKNEEPLLELVSNDPVRIAHIMGSIFTEILKIPDVASPQTIEAIYFAVDHAQSISEKECIKSVAENLISSKRFPETALVEYKWNSAILECGNIPNKFFETPEEFEEAIGRYLQTTFPRLRFSTKITSRGSAGMSYCRVQIRFEGVKK